MCPSQKQRYPQQEKLNEGGRAAKDADIGGAEEAEDRKPRQAHRRAECAAGQAEDGRQDRQLDRHPGGLQEEGIDPLHQLYVHDVSLWQIAGPGA